MTSTRSQLGERIFDVLTAAAFILAILFAVWNPFKYEISVVWELSALAATFLTMLIILADTLVAGENRLCRAITTRATIVIFLVNGGITFFLGLSASFALDCAFVDSILLWLGLQDFRTAVHAFVVFLGAGTAVLSSLFMRQLSVDPEKTSVLREKYEPIAAAERAHASLSLKFIDIPITLGFAGIFLVIWIEHVNAGDEVLLSSLALDKFLAGGIALSLMVANTAYILSRWTHNQ